MSVHIEFTGYRPGTLAAIVRLHIDHYYSHWQFELHFETKVASELAEILSRMECGNDLIVTAYDKSSKDLLGSIVIDAAHQDIEGAHLRWFIVEQQAAG